MSTLNVASIQSLTTTSLPVIKNSSGVEKGQFVKAWANIETGTSTSAGGSKTLNGSFNISSCTDKETGVVLINFATNFANINYCAVATSGHQISPIGSESNNDPSHTDTAAVEVRVLTTSSLVVVGEDVDNGYIDRDKVMIAIFSA
jgi:hypothetical protein